MKTNSSMTYSHYACKCKNIFYTKKGFEQNLTKKMLIFN